MDDIDAQTTYNPQSNKFDIIDADFKCFLVLWNQHINFKTPDIHLSMAEWLEYNEKQDNARLLLMAFRSAGKSTIVGIFAAWLLYRNPNLRILVLAADHMLATKMVRNVKRIIERHPLTLKLRPQNADQWASDRFTIKRITTLRDPSMLAKGITSNITGSRADIVICDDVEVPNTCDTAEKRTELRDRLGEMEFVLTPGGKQLYVGTPHNYHTIYADTPRKELGEDDAFLNGFKRLKIPVLDKNNESAWIEKYSKADIARMKHASGPNRFASQMMLEPKNITEGRLNPQLLKIYDEELDYTKELRTLFIGQTKLVSASAFWDPAFGSASGDHSVCAIMFSDDAGNFYLHHVAYIRNDETNEQDEATQQCLIVATLAKTHYLPAITVETNGIGKFLPTMLRNALTKAKTPCAVKEMHQKQNKDMRILEAFDAVLAAGRLYVHKSVLQTPFMTEMQEWRPKGATGVSKGHDDGLDAVAGALAQSPDRLTRIYGSGNHNWMRGQGSHKADTDFKV